MSVTEKKKIDDVNEATLGPSRSIKPTARQIRKKRGHKSPTSGMREGTLLQTPEKYKDNKEILRKCKNSLKRHKLEAR